MDFRLELVLVPVSDVDKSKAFYAERLGFAVDVDHRAGDSFRVVQLTPPGSACSIMVGIGITDSVPGAVKGLHLVVADVEAAHAELSGRGVPLSAMRHMTPEGWADGADPHHTDYNSFAEFTDPDGNLWLLQERGHGA